MRRLTVEEKEKYFKSVEKMIWSIAHQFAGISHQDKEDFVQEASIFLVENIAPKYDPSMNVEFKNFAYICIKNFMLRKVNNLNKGSKVVVLSNDLSASPPDCFFQSPYFDDADKITKLSRLLREDSPILKDNEKAVLRMIFENPKITQREMANKMGFSFASGAGAILGRLRKRIKEEMILED
jgi:RNA polymerase sigma factor (sigma-70 family)|nr:MAG TPA: DNA directed RNA polymerase subunit [Caudoviricetes sp.]